MNDVHIGEAIRAETRNEMIADLRRKTPVEGPLPKAAASTPHPWQCRVERGKQPTLWKVTMRAGFVNDVEAPVAYLAQNDPRGWIKPDKFPASKMHDGICERSWREPSDPPFLQLDLKKDFVPVPDASRQPFFMTASAWEYDLYRASVFLCARPLNVISGRILPARHRTWAGKMPNPLTAYPYGLCELARIFVLQGEEPEDASAFVQQREFYDLHSAPVEPVKLLPKYQPLDVSFGGYGFGLLDGAVAGFNIVSNQMVNDVNQALQNLQVGTSSVEFWSV